MNIKMKFAHSCEIENILTIYRCEIVSKINFQKLDVQNLNPNLNPFIGHDSEPEICIGEFGHDSSPMSKYWKQNTREGVDTVKYSFNV